MEREKGFEPSTLALAKPAGGSHAGARSRTVAQPRFSTQGGSGPPVHSDTSAAPEHTPFVTRLLPDAATVDRLLTVRDVARVLGVSAATVYRLVSEGQLPHVRVLNAIRLHPTHVHALIAASRTTRPS